MRNLDIIIPVKNEEKNVPEIVKQVHTALENRQISHQIFIIIDKSQDNTLNVAHEMAKKYPVHVHEKIGQGGKGFSILEGLDLTDAEYTGFIDGDLQYPPSALPDMYEKAKINENIGVVIANRKTYKSASLLRKAGSRTNVLIFGKLLLGLNCDIQSGLKIFKRDVIQHINRDLITPWTFDLPLLHAAKELGYKIDQVDIDFENRQNGQSHVGFVKTALAIATCAVKIKLSNSKIYHLHSSESYIGAAIAYKQKKYVIHTKLNHERSAIYTLSRPQKIFIALLIFALVISLTLNAYATVLTFVAILSFIYFTDMIFNFYLVSKSLNNPPELRFSDEELDSIDTSKLPTYTIMCPLYKEWEVIEQFVQNISKIDWPKDKLEVLLLLEENDTKTIEVA